MAEKNMLGKKSSLGSEVNTTIYESETMEMDINGCQEIVTVLTEEGERKLREDRGQKEKEGYILDEEFETNYMSNNDEGLKIKDAAALCQLTYVCDPQRAGNDVIYHTGTGKWRPFLSKKYNEQLSKYSIGFLDMFENHMPDMTMIQKPNILNKISYGRFRGDIFDDFDKNFSRKRTGFFSMLYYLPGPKYKFAYVLAGTTMNGIMDSINDWGTTNIPQSLTGFSPQYTLAIQNAKILDAICNEHGYDLCFMGHSLGGGMAMACALATDKEAVVFNNAGLSYLRNTIHGSYWDNYRHKIIRVFTDQDLLSTEKQNKSFMNHVNSVISHQKGVTKVYNQEDIGKLSDEKQKLKMPGKSIYLGKGGHGIDGICRALKLIIVGNKNQLAKGI